TVSLWGTAESIPAEPIPAGSIPAGSIPAEPAEPLLAESTPVESAAGLGRFLRGLPSSAADRADPRSPRAADPHPKCARSADRRLDPAARPGHGAKPASSAGRGRRARGWIRWLVRRRARRSALRWRPALRTESFRNLEPGRIWRDRRARRIRAARASVGCWPTANDSIRATTPRHSRASAGRVSAGEARRPLPARGGTRRGDVVRSVI